MPEYIRPVELITEDLPVKWLSKNNKINIFKKNLYKNVKRFLRCTITLN